MDGKGDRVKPNWVLISLTGAFDRRPGQSQALREAASGVVASGSRWLAATAPTGGPAVSTWPRLAIQRRPTLHYYVSGSGSCVIIMIGSNSLD
jgi:hypothetical protein